MFKVNNKDTRTTTLAIDIFIVNFEDILHLFLVFLLFTLNKKLPAGSEDIYGFSEFQKI